MAARSSRSSAGAGGGSARAGQAGGTAAGLGAVLSTILGLLGRLAGWAPRTAVDGQGGDEARAPGPREQDSRDGRGGQASGEALPRRPVPETDERQAHVPPAPPAPPAMAGVGQDRPEQAAGSAASDRAAQAPWGAPRGTGEAPAARAGAAEESLAILRRVLELQKRACSDQQEVLEGVRQILALAGRFGRQVEVGVVGP